MPSIYKRGYYYERKTVEYLRKAGWDAWGTPASKSPIDVIAIRKNGNNVEIKLIQVKSTSKNSFSLSNLKKEEREALLKLAEKYKEVSNVHIELWVYFKKEKRLEVLNIKNLV